MRPDVCQHCGAFIPHPRPGQRFCPAPATCRQAAWRLKMQTAAHRCGCGKYHIPEKWTDEP